MSIPAFAANALAAAISSAVKGVDSTVGPSAPPVSTIFGDLVFGVFLAI